MLGRTNLTYRRLHLNASGCQEHGNKSKLPNPSKFLPEALELIAIGWCIGELTSLMPNGVTRWHLPAWSFTYLDEKEGQSGPRSKEIISTLLSTIQKFPTNKTLKEYSNHQSKTWLFARQYRVSQQISWNGGTAYTVIEMPAPQEKNTSQTQPWKKNWPPVTVQKEGDFHGTAKGDLLAVDGGGFPGSPLSQIAREAEKWTFETYRFCLLAWSGRRFTSVAVKYTRYMKIQNKYILWVRSIKPVAPFDFTNVKTRCMWSMFHVSKKAYSVTLP
jgi:hypothetical protein